MSNPIPPSVKRQKSCGLTRAWLTPSPISWIDLLWFFFSLLLTKDTWSWFRGKNWWSVVREKWQCCCRWLWYCHVCRPWPRLRRSPPPGSPATPRSMWMSSVRSRSAGIRSGLIHLADLLSWSVQWIDNLGQKTKEFIALYTLRGRWFGKSTSYSVFKMMTLE